MKKIINQILKFGIVGVISFFVDFIITMIISTILRNFLFIETSYAAVIGAFFGFIISVIVNYILSMNYVFERRNDMNRKKEFIIFIILSTFGLIINELIILFCIDVIYDNWLWLNNFVSDGLITAIAKIIATGIVMVYNFITRKIFLEKKDK